MKWIGVLLIGLTGMGCGGMASLTLRCRVRSLERIARFLELLAQRIRYTAAPLEELLQEFARSAEFERLPFLRRMRQQPDDDRRRALAASVRESAREMSLQVEDERLLLEFADGWGAADLMGEVRRCEQYALLFRSRLDTAREALCREERLYLTLGICAGSTMALLLW